MKFWILARPRPQSNRCDAGPEEKEAPAASASADVSSAARVLKTPAIPGIYNARLKQPGNVNSSALMPVLGRKPFKYLSLAVRRRNETHTPPAVLARRMGLRMPALEAQWDRQGPARRGPDGRLAHQVFLKAVALSLGWQRLGQHMDRMHRGAPREIGDLMATRKPVGDDRLFSFGFAHSRHKIGLRHGARDVLRLGLIAKGAGHSTTG